VAVWYFIALVTLVEPAFYQRCYAARTEGVAKKGIWLSILFWLGFDLLTTLSGLYARVVLPDLNEPLAAFPELAARTLAPFWQGVFFVGLLATVMSTVDSYAFICAVTLGRDIIQRWRSPGKKGETTEVTTPSSFGSTEGEGPTSFPLIRWSLLVTAALSVALALWAGSVIRIWHHVGSVATPILLLPLGLSHTSVKLSGGWILWSMILGGGTSLLWLWLGKGEPFLGWEAIFPGLAASALVLLTAFLVSGAEGGSSTK
jgi:SSS family solute:Na+ symporter